MKPFLQTANGFGHSHQSTTKVQVSSIKSFWLTKMDREQIERAILAFLESMLVKLSPLKFKNSRIFDNEATKCNLDDF